MSLRSFSILVLICGLWAGNVLVSRFVVTQLAFPPLWFNVLRSVVLALAMSPWLLPIPRQLWRVVLTTFAIGGGGISLMYIGLRDATASAASIVSLSSAPITVIFAVIFLGEVVHWRRGLGIALAFAGVIVAIASPTDMRASFGLMIVFVAAVCGGLGAVFLKQLDMSALRLQAWAGLTSTVLLVPLSVFFEDGQLGAMSGAGWPLVACLVYAALGVSIVAHTLYYRLLQTHDANVIAPLMLMSPVFTVLMGAFITGETVSMQLILGGLIAMIGVLVILVRPSATLFKPFLLRTRI